MNEATTKEENNGRTWDKVRETLWCRYFNCYGVHRLKPIFINLVGLIMNYFDLVINNYDHCYKLM